MTENSATQDQPVIYTIGCSTHDFQLFLSLLRTNKITVIVDVRSTPSSAYEGARHFNQGKLTEIIGNTDGIRYLFLGKELGGLPDGAHYRDEKGHIKYDLIEQAEEFQQAIERLLKGVKMDRIALMCAEEPPAKCHRGRLLGRVLSDRGLAVLHIRGDGRVQTQEEVFEEITGGQLDLFGQGVAPYLRSSKPHPKKREGRRSSDVRESLKAAI